MAKRLTQKPYPSKKKSYCEENVYLCLRSQSLLNPKSLNEFTVVFLSNPAGCVPLFAQRAAKQPGVPVFWDYHVVLVHKKSSSSTSSAVEDCREEHTSHGGNVLIERTPQEDNCGGKDEEEEEYTDEAVIYDLDTTLPDFPVSFKTYFNATFRPPGDIVDEWLLYRLSDPAYKRYMRLVPGGLFLKKFASSRVHMRRRVRTTGGEGREGGEEEEEEEWLAEPPVWECLKGEEAESEHTLPMFLDFSRAGEEDGEGGDGYGRIVDEEGFWREFMGEGREE